MARRCGGCMSQEAWDRLVARNHPSTRDTLPGTSSFRQPKATGKTQRKLGRPRFLADGSIAFPTKGNPPPCPEGYAKAPGDKFRFIPTWDPCRDRSLTFVMQADGTMNVQAKCVSTEAETAGLPVCQAICSQCPFRRA